MNSDSSTAAVIDLANLSRRFDSKLALDQVSLAVPRGCVFGLVGENGAGKTTLVKLLSRMYVPTSGRILLHGVPLDRGRAGEWGNAR